MVGEKLHGKHFVVTWGLCEGATCFVDASLFAAMFPSSHSGLVIGSQCPIHKSAQQLP